MLSSPARALLLIGVCTAGCAGARLLPGSDPRIEAGMTGYQESLETFVRQTLLHYEQCTASRDDVAACRAASYANGAESFYIPEAARLSVLRNLAAVLDSTGACQTAASGLASFVTALIPPKIHDLSGAGEAAGSANCTERLVQTVIENHEALAEGHRRIDEVLGPGQAEPFFLIQRDTLVQNVRIVLLLEAARKRGRPSR